MRLTTYILGLSLLLAALCGCDKADKRAAPAQEQIAEAAGSETDKADESESSTSMSKKWKASDAHTHLSPYAYPLAIRAMNESRIYRAVNMSGGFAPRYRRANLRAADEYPGRIALFFNMNWRAVNEPGFGEEMARQLEAAVAQGYAGLKVAKHLGLGAKDADGELIAVDDPRFDPVWEKAGELGVPVAIHTGDPKAFFEKPTPENERWDELKLAPSWSFYGEEFPSRKELLDARNRVVAKHPDTTFILLHFGGNPEDLDYVDELLDTYPNVLIDVAARVAEIGRHPVKKVREFFAKHQDRIIFATDLGLRARPTEQGLNYRVTLGSVSAEPPTIEDIAGFYRKHWRYFESDEEAIEHPIPIQGRWKVHPIHLSQKLLDKLYWKNAEREIFAPWLGRRAANRLIATARSLPAADAPTAPQQTP
jgi:predicted TIM-barrel fold metal-dependent hydrolase